MLRIRAELALVWIALVGSASGAKLPIRAFTVSDGLPSNSIAAVVRDSRGFLWFATREGLSRFDGYDFINYTRANGLPRNAVSAFLEARDGAYWAGTAAGVARLEPSAAGPAQLSVFAPDDPMARQINVIFEDRAGQLWCGTEGGLFRLNLQDAARHEWRFQRVPIVLSSGKAAADQRVISLFEDSHGDLWIGTITALYRRMRNERAVQYRQSEYTGTVGAALWHDELWRQVLEDRRGHLWAATGIGLWRLEPDGKGDYHPEPVFIPRQRMVVFSLLEDPGGRMWLGTSGGLIECPGGGDRCATEARRYTEANGLTTNGDVQALANDWAGNLWLGTAGEGAMRIERNGLLTYTAADGLGFTRAVAPTLFLDRAGAAQVAFQHILNVRRGDRFVEVRPAIPKTIKNTAWGWHQTVLQDHAGDWWISTSEGLFRFPNVSIEALGLTAPTAHYTTSNGLRTNDIFRIFEDSRRGIWVACIGLEGVNGLSRWDRETETFHSFPVHDSTAATAFAEDRAGSIWIGYYDGALARYRRGSMALYGSADGLATGGIQALHVDRKGWLWVASTTGLARTDAPDQPQPRFQRFDAGQGLSSSRIQCLDEDRWGRLYVANGSGVDRLNASGEIAPGVVRHYTEADGLARGEVRDILFDREGDLWCATAHGISRFTPEAENNAPPPPVFIRQLRVRGVPLPLSDLGGAFAPRLTFAPSQNQLQIDFAALAFTPGEVLHYQYRLEPADAEWSPPSKARTVNYSDLAPGRYRFSARLATGGGSTSKPAAILEFTILTPIWKRLWFRLILACVALGLLHWLYRYRTIRLLELERVRTRIAADLHDDIGSGLSQIAVLTEVGRARLQGQALELSAVLGDIGAVSRELAESMNDIVWSVNPQRDRASDLFQRMRRFASDVLAGSNIDFDFRASAPGNGVPIPTELRREVYLIFKEAVTNVVRHSASTHAEIEISIDAGRLQLRVEDNGNGLDGRGRKDGQGLRSMSERARRIGGEIEFGRGECGGLRIVLRAALHVTRARSNATA